jgi:hypothetical protein
MIINSYSQNLDLVVTARRDSIACKIDSITESVIYLQIKTHGNNKWMPTFYNTDNIIEFKYDCIDPSKFAFRKGTSIIIGPSQPVYPDKYPGKLNLEKASQDELNFYLTKVKKTKRTGIIMLIAGPLSSGAGILIAAASYSGGTSGGFTAGYLMFLAGIGTTIVSIPILITGSSRVKTINEIKKSRGMTMEFIPGGYYNQLAQNYQPGATLRIRF